MLEKGLEEIDREDHLVSEAAQLCVVGLEA